MRFEFEPQALFEYEESMRFYAERQPGLEIRYIECVEDAIARIREKPLTFRLFEGEVRICLTHVFPYAVLYTIETDHILILAVMHCRREPGYWKDRMPQR